MPILVGPAAKIRAVAERERNRPRGLQDHRRARTATRRPRGVALAREGTVEALMKGSLHTDELMGEVVATDTGLRTERRISHVFIMDVPTYPRALLITDAAINIDPTLDDKVDIVQNAIDLAHVLGCARAEGRDPRRRWKP